MLFKKFLLLSFNLYICFVLSTSVVFAESTREYGTSPTLNNHKKWRIGYVEGGNWFTYPLNLKAILEGLMELGWIKQTEIAIEKGSDDSKKFWDWITHNIHSDYIEFAQDAFWSSNWQFPVRKKTVDTIIKRWQEKNDIDLLLALGTRAGQDLSTNDHSIPTIVIDASDPVAAKIIKSAEDSGYDHLHARCDPKRFQRQVRLFHEIVGFDTLGLPYMDDDVGRSYSALNDVEKVASERKFKIVHQPFPRILNWSTEQYYALGLESFQKLGELGVGAVYVTEQTAMDLKNFPNLAKILLKYKIPSFAQSSSEFVKKGALLSISQAGYKYVGQFHAKTIARIFNGATPRHLPQIFEAPQRIAINMKTAKLIGFEPPIDWLGIADEIYTEIE